MLRNRKGVTLIEIMTVVAMAIVMTAIAFPKLKETKRASSMQSARIQVESYLAVARSVAIRTGVRAVLVREGSTMKILADSANTLVLVVRPVQLDSVSQVVLSSAAGTTADTIIYDSRGIATNLGSTGQKFYITVGSGHYGAGTKDSVCVTRLGLVLDKKCGLAVTAPEKYEDEPVLDDGGGIVIDDPIILDPSIK